MTRLLSRLLLLLQIVPAGVVLYLAPHGFPLWHGRFWVHSGLPVLGILAVVGLQARPSWGPSVVFGFWTSLAVSLVLRFAGEGTVVAWVTAGMAAPALLLAAWTFWSLREKRRPTALAVLAPVPVGIFIALALGAPAPSTTPVARAVTLPEWRQSTVLNGEGLYVNVDPLLSVHDASVSGFQTVFTFDAPLSILNTVYGERLERGLRLEAVAEVPDGVWAHLSSFLSLRIHGHTELAVELSPCPGVTLPVEHAEYPWGAPIKVAYVTEDRRFVVARATTGEKGPYQTLCEGTLRPEDPLVMTFSDLGVPKLRATVHDFASQASTELSPAAGGGLPQNAVQFSLRSPDRSTEAFVHLTLASTGIGIGWDSVGLTPGRYSNRVELALLP
jgi:hypothetical protein